MKKETLKNVASSLDKTTNVIKSAVVVIGATKVLVEAIADLADKIK